MMLMCCQLDNTPVPNEDVSDLTITVVSAMVQKASNSDGFPKWGPLRTYIDVTDGTVDTNVGEMGSRGYPY